MRVLIYTLNSLRLKLPIEINLKEPGDFDVTVNLESCVSMLLRKPNENLRYINLNYCYLSIMCRNLVKSGGQHKNLKLVFK